MRLNLPKRQQIKAPAGIFKRVLAFVIDLLILDFFVTWPFKGLLKGLMPSDNFSEIYAYIQTNPSIGNQVFIGMVSISIIFILYFTVLEYKFKQSIGKRLMNLYVESDQKELKLWQVLVRNMFLLPFFPFVILWILDPLYLIFNRNQIRFSEWLSKTKVVEYYSLK